MGIFAHLLCHKFRRVVGFLFMFPSIKQAGIFFVRCCVLKKVLCGALASVLTLGSASVTFAANPFSDVPAGHWAYKSVTKLALEGVIEGYGDGTFLGNRNITRYEMAQMIAKAMAKNPQAHRKPNSTGSRLNFVMNSTVSAFVLQNSKNTPMNSSGRANCAICIGTITKKIITAIPINHLPTAQTMSR